MKKLFLLMGMAATMFAFTGCQKNEMEAPKVNEGGSTFELVADIAQTKTTLDAESYKVAWETSDIIYMVTAGADTPWQTATEFVYADGKFNTETELSAGTYIMNALYAASDQAKYHKNTSTTHKLQSAQTQDCKNPTEHIKANDALVGTFTATVPMTEVASVNMNHIYTLMQVNVKNNTGAAIEVAKFEMTAAGADLAGIFNITSFETPAIETKQDASESITVNVTGGSVADGEYLPVYFVMAPIADYSGDVTFKVTDSEGNTYSKTVKMNGISFKAGEYNTTSYAISEADEVEQPGETTGAWTLVTDASTLAVGDKVVIAAAEFNYALSTDQRTNNRNQAAITKNNNTATLTEDVQVLTLEAGTKEGTYAFNTGNGYLYAASSSKNHLKTETKLSDNSSWTISVNESGVATIKASGSNTRNWLRYNSTNPDPGPIFSCYGSGQADVALYRLSGDNTGGGETPEPEPQEPYIRVSQEEFNVPATQTSVTFNVEANVGWDVEHTEGVTDVIIIEVSEDALVMTVEATFGENESADSQTHTITFIPEELDETVTVTINQAAKVEVDDSFEPGDYWIVANGKYAMPVTSNFDYLKVDDAGYKDNVFTFKKVENGYTIQQSDDKYLYMKGTYNNFNVSATAPTEGHIWTIAKNEDGSYKILNVLKSKYIQLDSQHGTYGSYDAVKGTMPNLVPADDAKDRPVFSVTPTSKSVACDVIEASFDIVSNLNWTVVAGENVSVDVTSGSGNGTVTMTFAENKSEESVVYRATVKAEGFEDIVLTVTQSGVSTGGGDAVVEWHTESWSMCKATANTYATGTFEGDLGTWSYTGCSSYDAAQFKTQKSLALGKTADNSSITSPTFNNGVKGIKFNYFANNTARKVVVTIYENGVEVKKETITPSAKNTLGSAEISVETSGATYFTFTPGSSDRRVSVGDIQVKY